MRQCLTGLQNCLVLSVGVLRGKGATVKYLVAGCESGNHAPGSTVLTNFLCPWLILMLR